MLKDNIDKLIVLAIKNKENAKLSTLRLIKTELVKKEKDGVVIDEASEANILNKMMQQREDTIEQYKKANRLDLAEIEQNELNIIKTLAPKQATEEEISFETERIISTMENISMKDMKNILTMVQKTYPTANGKIVSEIVKKHLK